MSKLQLPSRSGDAWEAGFVWDEWRDVQSIEARGGMVVAGGADFYLLKPGAENWKMRPPPEDIGPMHLVAAEPRGARRYAVASAKMFALFFKGKKGDEILRLKPPEEAGSLVTHLAWGGVRGACALYVLRVDATLLRMKPDLSDLEELDVEEMSALASDDSGTVAMVALNGDAPRVYVMRDGVEMKFRAIDHPIEPDTSIEIAVADTAVALVVDGKYVLVSRGLEAPFERVDLLDSPEGSGWQTGPIAFQGTTGDAALFCARWENELQRIVRVDAAGAAMSIVEMRGDEKHDPPEVAALTWDASRQTLWGASPYTGIFRCVPPGAKGKKKPLLS